MPWIHRLLFPVSLLLNPVLVRCSVAHRYRVYVCSAIVAIGISNIFRCKILLALIKSLRFEESAFSDSSRRRSRCSTPDSHIVLLLCYSTI
ncbi:hypothetical protein B0H21DRAFT_482839 [Amylocystis lapponica]|nr:hypothetical protein B0H21DRAFT_482839 [Amylocystis lapponica]